MDFRRFLILSLPVAGLLLAACSHTPSLADKIAATPPEQRLGFLKSSCAAVAARDAAFAPEKPDPLIVSCAAMERDMKLALRKQADPERFEKSYDACRAQSRRGDAVTGSHVRRKRRDHYFDTRAVCEGYHWLFYEQLEAGKASR